MDGSIVSLSPGDDVKPYKIHVSSKYLDLTRKKLELTRLPHEILLPKSREWESGTPKSAIEPLIDFWLEKYQWRDQESHFNASLPQFRTAITVPSSPTPLRIHFVHFKSPHPNALPLLLVPSFPLTNLSLTPLFTPLTDPKNPQDVQPYHVIAPSIPGIGFSDALSSAPGETSFLTETAYIFNTLMVKLGYEFYLASGTGSGLLSPSSIDYHLPRILATNHARNCVGIHLIDPPYSAPTFAASPWHWTKFAFAKFFHASIFGYTSADWAVVTVNGRSSSPLFVKRLPHGAIGRLGLREPNTLAYALCDSPVGLLSLVLNGIRKISPGHALSNANIIDIAQLAWLPGPEGAMRYWASAEAEVETPIKYSTTPTAVTVFENDEGIIMPAWVGMHHRLLWARRQPERSGLVAWERTEAVIEGIRGLTEQVLKEDARLALPALEEVVVTVSEIVNEEFVDEGDLMQLDVESPDTVIQG